MVGVGVKDTASQQALEVAGSIQRLHGWIEANGWAGYDPYDIRGHPLFLHIHDADKIISRLLRITLGYADAVFPVSLRKVFHVDKQINAKGMGLFASAYLDLYRSTGEESYLEKAREALGWLEKNNTREYQGFCWGYPFDWQSLHFLPKGTPSGVVSACVGDAFFSLYEITGEEKHLDICRSVCEFFIKNLNIDRISGDKLCFSYTPLDSSHCHNANLFVAEFLIRIGHIIGNEEYTEYGAKSLRYTLDEQNEDGSFYYFGPEDRDTYRLPEETMRRIDHYHTGFVLRCLSNIYRVTQDKGLLTGIEHCYRHYKENLFEGKTIPKYSPQSKYPINIHSCAEAILCMSALGDLFPDTREYAGQVFQWTKKNMQTKSGWFIYLVMASRIRGLEWKIRAPYIRWGQAWMLRAMAHYYYRLINTK